MRPPIPRPSLRAPLVLVACAAAIQLAGATLGAFRSDDWTNLDRGHWATTPEGLRGIWASLNPFALYRPLVDLWHAAMISLFGVNAPPMIAMLVLLLLAQSWLLGRLVRERGGSALAAALAAAAMWAQVNVYAWTTQWISNATGSLLALFSLLALVQHHRAVRAAARGRSPWPAIALMLASFVAGALSKEEIVLLPAGLAILELARWRTLGERERRGALTSWVALAVVAAAYVWFRTVVVPTPQSGMTRYHLRLGPHLFTNAGHLLLHLGAMPAVVWLLTRLLWPAAHERAIWNTPEGRAARAEALGALGWSLASTLLYLPIAGRPAFGYLYMPAFAVSYATGRLLAHAALHARPGRVGASSALAAHMALATLATAIGLVLGQWHTYRDRTLDTWAHLDRDWPNPPGNARFVFLDSSGAETYVGRSIFSLIYGGEVGAMLRLHYHRKDVRGLTMIGPEAVSLASLPDSVTAVYRTRLGRIERVVNVPAARADEEGAATGNR